MHLLCYDVKLYNYGVLRQTMARNPSLPQSQVTNSENSLWEIITLETQESSFIGKGEKSSSIMQISEVLER